MHYTIFDAFHPSRRLPRPCGPRNWQTVRHRERSEAISSQVEIATGLRPSQW